MYLIRSDFQINGMFLPDCVIRRVGGRSGDRKKEGKKRDNKIQVLFCGMKQRMSMSSEIQLLISNSFRAGELTFGGAGCEKDRN